MNSYKDSKAVDSKSYSACLRGITVLYALAASLALVFFLYVLGSITGFSASDSYKAAVVGGNAIMLIIMMLGFPATYFNIDDDGNLKKVLDDEQNRARSHYYIHCGLITSAILFIWWVPVIVLAVLRFGIVAGFMNAFGIS